MILRKLHYIIITVLQRLFKVSVDANGANKTIAHSVIIMIVTRRRQRDGPKSVLVPVFPDIVCTTFPVAQRDSRRTANANGVIHTHHCDHYRTIATFSRPHQRTPRRYPRAFECTVIHSMVSRARELHQEMENRFPKDV